MLRFCMGTFGVNHHDVAKLFSMVVGGFIAVVGWKTFRFWPVSPLSFPPRCALDDKCVHLNDPLNFGSSVLNPCSSAC